MHLTISILDIGKIHWDANNQTYTSQGTHKFEGLDLGNIAFNGEEVFDFDTTIDTLNTLFDFQTSVQSFSTRLPSQLYASLLYELNEQWQLGALVHTVFYKGAASPTLALNAMYQPLENIYLGLTYSMEEDAYFNVGFNASVQFGPFQLYGMTNNILSVFQPANTNYLTAGIGIGVVF